MRPGGCCAVARPTRPSPNGFVNSSPPKAHCSLSFLAVEVTDLLFAVDSIPAVLAVSHNPFVVYTSKHCRHPRPAPRSTLPWPRGSTASVISTTAWPRLLAFVALKLLAARWIGVPITLSLAINGSHPDHLRSALLAGRQKKLSDP